MLERACVGNEASVLDAVIGREATLEPGAAAAGGTIIGASVVIAAGSRLSGARVPLQASPTP
jgi:acetyltransferase-like isoleucine patch superfamily enzyme